MRRTVLLLLACTAIGATAQPLEAPRDPTPQSLGAFQETARRILDETGVPGAGLALVRADGVEWVGGIGFADRARSTPVTADTHFRIGSISKTFVAMALVQLSEDGELDLDATVAELLPGIDIDNPWEATDPVRLIHLLQHTAGFDDMHFNQVYAPAGEEERPLMAALAVNTSPYRVRWRPGTRMAYSNPGYGLAGLVLEHVSGMPYEDYIEEEIFRPLGMTTSSFRLGRADEALLAQGYDSPAGPPVGYPAIYLRPAGNMHSSPAEMARFVQMLLGWGELGHALVIDPEYLGNMEQPRTTAASAAGLRNGYGTGIFTTLTLPYKVLGHGGGIDGFLSTYGYSPARDVGYVILLNGTGPGAGEALTRLSSLAIRYLKRDVEPAAPPAVDVGAETLDRYVGYYHEASPRNQIAWALEWLASGLTIVRDRDALYANPVLGPPQRLLPVTGDAFRLEGEVDASRVFTDTPEGAFVLAGGRIYAERMPRWRVELVRLPVLLSAAIVGSVFAAALFWVVRARRAQPRGFWELKTTLLLCPLALIAPAVALWLTPTREWGRHNAATTVVFLGTALLPILTLLVAAFTINAIRERASRWLVTYAAAVALATGVLCLYLGSHDLLGLRLWDY